MNGEKIILNHVIEVVGLTKQYSSVDKPVLNRVSFDVPAGSFTTILGRSGSGKSTLFRCLNLLLRPTSGQMHILGQDWLSLDSHELCVARRQMATIFQQYNLINRLTVMENVLAGQLANVPFWRAVLRRFPSVYYDWALHCLERVGLQDFADRQASQLSGGQQQRVAIARALAQRPRIILADEPVASLDTTSSITVLNELRNIVDNDGITVLCSLHQEDLALKYGAHIIGLREGEVVVNVPRREFSAEHRASIYQV